MADKGHVSNTYADGYGVWHAEVTASEGNGPEEVFGCTWQSVRNRAAKAIHAEIAARQGATPPAVRVDYLGMFRRNNGSFVALFKERA